MGVGLPHSLPRRVREGDGEERAPGANCNHAQARRWWQRWRRRARTAQNQVKSKVLLHRRLSKSIASSFPPQNISHNQCFY